MQNKVVIIGNGFDLDQGLKTSYKHFLSDGVQPGVDERNVIIQTALDQGENWCDVEMALANVIAREAKLTQNKDRQEDIKKSYVQVVRLLKAYIEGEQRHRQIKFDHSKPSYRMIEDLLRSEFAYIKLFDFNYTNTIKSILEALPQKSNILHYKVHGSVDQDEIIFGVENYSDVVIPSQFTYAKKSHSDLFYVETKISDELIGAHEIHFFGHSLGESDEIHFAKYFEEVMRSEVNPINAKQSLIVYLDPQDSDNCKLRFNSRIDALTDGRLAEFKQAVNIAYK